MAGIRTRGTRRVTWPVLGSWRRGRSAVSLDRVDRGSASLRACAGLDRLPAGSSAWVTCGRAAASGLPCVVPVRLAPAMSERVRHVSAATGVPTPHSSWSASSAVRAAGLAQPVRIAARTTHGPTRRRRARLGARWLVVMHRIVRTGAGGQHRSVVRAARVPAGGSGPPVEHAGGARGQQKSVRPRCVGSGPGT
jgi:hypothetical protein